VLLYNHGYSPRELKKAVASVVADEVRRDAAQSEIKYWSKALEAQNKDLGKAQKKIVKLARQHDATRAEADRIVANMDDSIRRMDRSFLDARFQLKGQLTQAEWDALWGRLEK
jgi:molecular chaperone GrpE (heat shock protein)